MHRLPERLYAETGRIIYAEGDASTCAYLLLRGRVELRIGVDGEPRTVAVRGAGDMFGELALVDDSLRQATAVAVEDCELLAITSAEVSGRLESADPLLRISLSAIMTRFSETVEQIRRQLARPSDPAVLPVWTTHSAAARAAITFEHELRTGIERGELDLSFQPIVRLNTGHLVGFEALVRWQHPRRGILMPADFIPFAETSGVISDVTTLCFRKVGLHFPLLKAAQAQNPDNVDRLFVSVNVSGLDLAQSAFASQTVSLLGDLGIEPEDVKLEVTESILMADAQRCAQTLTNCRDQGFAIAIDDFGTGYSSLHYLNALPISVLKMDRSFCQSLLFDAAGQKIISAILHLGRELGLSVIAEGVEQALQRDMLRAMGCAYGQGYLFGAAMSCAQTVQLIGAWRAEAVPPEDALSVSPAA